MAGPGIDARRLAAEALRRIEDEGAYANLVLPGLLAGSGLERRDRALVTELVYGTTRMRRACDHLADRFITRPPDPAGRRWLRLGTYQLVFLDTPPHAAVSATVGAAPANLRGFLNAVLRKVAGAPRTYPSEAVELSYPDWIVARLQSDLGRAQALEALGAMNVAAGATTRDDGYVQDLASQWVAAAVPAAAGERVLDAAAAPGGKASALAAAGAQVVAADVRPSRVRLLAANLAGLGADVPVLCADGRRPPFRAAAFHHVLLDAPCSGLGTLRRRPDARWRIEEAAVDELVALQRALVEALVPLVRPGGTFTYSVCTLTEAEGPALDAWLAADRPDLAALDPLAPPWEAVGRGSRLLPQSSGTDGMYLLRLRVPGGGR